MVASNNASKQQMGFNSALKRLKQKIKNCKNFEYGVSTFG